MLKFQTEIQEIADRATAKHRSGESSTAAVAAAPGGSSSSASGPSTSKAGHKKSPSTESKPGPSSSKAGGKARSPVVGTTALPGSSGAGSSAASSSAAGAAQSTSSLSSLIASPLPPSLLPLLLPSSGEPWSNSALAALVDALERALRQSPAHELLVTLGRRATLGSWYRTEKRGIRPGSATTRSFESGEVPAVVPDDEVVEWEGEALPEGAELATLEGRLQQAMAELGGELTTLLRLQEPSPSLTTLLRLPPPSLEHLPELRIAVVGNVDAGKSTTLGVLTRGGLDDGRGRARVSLFRHKHELESGRTSSVGMEILGFDARGEPVLGGGAAAEATTTTDALTAAAPTGGRRERLGWEEICQRSAKVVSFIDLAGHERYLKTTIFGMTGCAPDYCLLMVGANAGLIGMSKEHLAVALALNVPVIVCITKIDMTPAHVLDQTKAQLGKILRSPGCRRTPVFVEDARDVVELSQTFVRERLCPIFLLSNVTGESLPLLRSFLNLLPTSLQAAAPGSSAASSSSPGRYAVDAPLEYSISDVFSVPFVGTVVNGVLNAGTVKTGDTVLLGPDSLGQFVSTSVKSIQRKRASVSSAEAGQSVSFALKRVRRTAVRKGMVIVARPESGELPRAVRRFEGQVLVLYHNTTIQPGYQAVMHTGAVRQTCRIVTMDHPKGLLRTGDRCTVVFEFVSAPEFVKEGDKLLFREGKTKGLGVITRVLA